MESIEYSVTIMNKSQPDVDGFMHTWLVFEPEEHFSFDSPNVRSAITCDSSGAFEHAEKVASRTKNEHKTFRITKHQYEEMLTKKLLFSEKTTYALIPLKQGEYNCVVAAREILKSAGIDFLNDVQTPIGVSGKILGKPTYKEEDAEAVMYGLVPRASAAVVDAVGLNLNNGPWGWVVGGAAALAGGYCLYKMNKKT